MYFIADIIGNNVLIDDTDGDCSVSLTKAEVFESVREGHRLFGVVTLPNGNIDFMPMLEFYKRFCAANNLQFRQMLKGYIDIFCYNPPFPIYETVKPGLFRFPCTDIRNVIVLANFMNYRP